MGDGDRRMIVVDCSAVVDALAFADGTERLRARLRDEELHAPHLIDVEVVSVLRRLVVRGLLRPDDGQTLLDDFGDLPIERWPVNDALRRRAFALRDNLTAYDATYVALAEALDCPLVTRDVRLARAPGHAAVVETMP